MAGGETSVALGTHDFESVGVTKGEEETEGSEAPLVMREVFRHFCEQGQVIVEGGVWKIFLA